MIQVIDNQRNILAHIHIDIIRTGQKLRSLVNEIRRQNPVNDTVLIVLIKLCKTVREETKGCTDEDFSCLSALEFLCDILHALAGRNHIVNDDDILALYA